VFFIHNLNVNSEYFRDLHGFILMKKKDIVFFMN
jgi:hypothetical protein